MAALLKGEFMTQQAQRGKGIHKANHLWHGSRRPPVRGGTRGRATASMSQRIRPQMGLFIYSLIAFGLGAYFTFAAVQGDYGLFRRAEIDAETDALRAQLKDLSVQVARMENLTLRLSDDFLDTDLLDQQARDVLGLLRPDEIVIR